MSIPAKKIVSLALIVSLVGITSAFGLKIFTTKDVTSGLEKETIYGPIKLTLNLDKTTFELGEIVNVTVTITNISNETIGLYYWSAPKADFAVYNSSSQRIFLFASDFGGGWLGILDGVALSPSESYTDAWEWDQKVIVGKHRERGPVDSGTYYITGRTGPLLYYLGPLDEWQKDYEYKDIITIETPKIEIQIT